MDAVLNVSNEAVTRHQPVNSNSADSLIISSLGNGGTPLSGDTVDVGLDDLYKGLAVSAQQILARINDALGHPITPDIDPATVTPEATADTVVKGIASLFSIYEKQHPELSKEELLDHFFTAARSGVEQGYSDAYDMLKGLGAFEYDGVEDGIKQTKSLIEEKLKNFEAQKRVDYGLDAPPATTEESVSQSVKGGLLTQAGISIVV